MSTRYNSPRAVHSLHLKLMMLPPNHLTLFLDLITAKRIIGEFRLMEMEILETGPQFIVLARSQKQQIAMIMRIQ